LNSIGLTLSKFVVGQPLTNLGFVGIFYELRVAVEKTTLKGWQ